MTTAMFQLQYSDAVGFVADQGGRGFHLPMSMVIRGDGRIFVVSRSNTQALDIVGIQMVTRGQEFFGQIGGYGREPGKMIWPTALALDRDDNLYLADDYLQRITVYDRDGAVRGTWGTKGSGAGEFDGAVRPAVRRRRQPAGGRSPQPPHPEIHPRRPEPWRLGHARQRRRAVQPAMGYHAGPRGLSVRGRLAQRPHPEIHAGRRIRRQIRHIGRR